MKLKPNRQIAWNKLFGNPMSIEVVILDIENEGFRRLPEGETVLQYWTALFGDRGKKEAIALLRRVQRAKNYDYEVFKRTFAQKYTEKFKGG